MPSFCYQMHRSNLNISSTQHEKTNPDCHQSCLRFDEVVTTWCVAFYRHAICWPSCVTGNVNSVVFVVCLVPDTPNLLLWFTSNVCPITFCRFCPEGSLPTHSNIFHVGSWELFSSLLNSFSCWWDSHWCDRIISTVTPNQTVFWVRTCCHVDAVLKQHKLFSSRGFILDILKVNSEIFDLTFMNVLMVHT